MQKRSSTKKGQVKVSSRVKRAADSNLQRKNPAAVALGRLGGLKGGKARAEKLSDERRREIAKRAAQMRWSTHEPK